MGPIATPSLRARGRTFLARHPWVAGLLGTLTSRALMVGVGLLSTVILARSLGPTGRGIFAVAVSTSLVSVAIGTLGYHVANPHYAAREPEQLGALLTNSMVLGVMTALVAGIASVIVWAVDPVLLPVTGALLLLVVLWIPVGIAFAQLQPVMLIVGKVSSFNIVEAGWQISATTLIVVLWLLGRITPVTAFGATLASLAGASVWLVFQLGRRATSLRPSWVLLARTFPFAGRSYLASLVGLLLVRLDILVVRGVLGATEAGYYSVAAAVGEMIILVPATVGVLLFPRLTALYDKASMLAVVRRVALATGLGMLVLCSIFWLAAPLTIRILFGADYLPSVTAIRWTMPGLVFLGANVILIYYFLAIGMPITVICGQALAVVVNVVLDLLILTHIGLAGAGLASSVAYGLMLVVSLAYLWLHRSEGDATPTPPAPDTLPPLPTDISRTIRHQADGGTPSPSRSPYPGL